MKNKVLNKDKRFIVIMAVTVALAVICFNITANATEKKPEAINSRGKIIFDNGTEDVSDDVIFDADDIYHLYEVCK